MIKDNQTEQEVAQVLNEYANESILVEEMSKQGPIYNPTDIDPGQSFENLLVSIKKQNKVFPHPVLAFGSIWTSFRDLQGLSY